MSESAAPLGPPASTSPAVRARILRAAAEAFRAKGYAETGLAEVAADAGVTEDDLVGCFASKRAIAIALLAEDFVLDVKARWIDPLRKADDVGAAIAKVFRDVAAALDEAHARTGAPIRYLALELSTADEDFRVIVDALFDGWRDVIEKRLAEAGDPDAAQLATFAVTAFSAVMGLAKANQSVGVVTAAADQIEERFAQRARAA